MTRKDYEMLAKLIKEAPKGVSLMTFVGRLVNHLQLNNSGFDSYRFLKAAGLTSLQKKRSDDHSD